LAQLGETAHISEALRKLVAIGVLIRLGKDFYAKAFRDENGSPVPAGTPQEVIAEVLSKLKIKPKDVSTEGKDANYTITFYSSSRRITRHFTIGSCQVEIITHSVAKKIINLPKDTEKLPRSNVATYIEELAKYHHLSSKKTGLDEWTEAVSRAAGDTVELDSIGRLLATLKQNHLINGEQMAHLMHNYLKEHDKEKQYF